MLADFSNYLPDDLLCKIDRTTMASGLEARTPLLDYRVAELAWSLSQNMKYRDDTMKYLLKRVLCRYLPDHMVYRGKRGFGAPVTDWLRTDLQGWASDLLEPARLNSAGLLNARTIGMIQHRFSQSERKWHTHIWNVLMFEAWRSYWKNYRAGDAQPL